MRDMRLVLLLLLELCSVTVVRCYMAIWLQGDRPKARNITVFPPCVSDQDCTELSSTHKEDYRCFQYMCYPWRREDHFIIKVCWTIKTIQSIQSLKVVGGGFEGQKVEH